MNNRKSIGLITYHSAYNYGSVMQTFGTIKTLNKLGYEVETIDYRTPSQTLWYQTDFSFRKGLRDMILNFGFKIHSKERKERARKFENFISSNLCPSASRYTTWDQIRLVDNYEILVSGSDQIWNFDCGEFRSEPIEAIYPYFLKFGNPKKRIAYASSFGVQTYRFVQKYAKLLDGYDYLSTREPKIAEYIRRITGREITHVCDPTWLLTKKEWGELPGLYVPKVSRKYILMYILGGAHYWKKAWLPAIKTLAQKLGCDVYCISPLNYLNSTNINMLDNAGPLDIMSYMRNAELIITNTFHGTIIPINIEVPFFSCQVEPGGRQGQMLEYCGLEDRIINDPSDIASLEEIGLDFTYAREKISALREKSIEYLRNALK